MVNIINMNIPAAPNVTGFAASMDGLTRLANPALPAAANAARTEPRTNSSRGSIKSLNQSKLLEGHLLCRSQGLRGRNAGMRSIG